MTNTCKICNSSFESVRSDKRTCSLACKKKLQRKVDTNGTQGGQRGQSSQPGQEGHKGDKRGRPVSDPILEDLDRYRINLFAPRVGFNHWGAEIDCLYLPTGFNKRSWSVTGDTAREVALGAAAHAKYVWGAAGETPCWWEA